MSTEAYKEDPQKVIDENRDKGEIFVVAKPKIKGNTQLLYANPQETTKDYLSCYVIE